METMNAATATTTVESTMPITAPVLSLLSLDLTSCPLWFGGGRCRVVPEQTPSGPAPMCEAVSGHHLPAKRSGSGAKGQRARGNSQRLFRRWYASTSPHACLFRTPRTLHASSKRCQETRTETGRPAHRGPEQTEMSGTGTPRGIKSTVPLTEGYRRATPPVVELGVWPRQFTPFLGVTSHDPFWALHVQKRPFLWFAWAAFLASRMRAVPLFGVGVRHFWPCPGTSFGRRTTVLI